MLPTYIAQNNKELFEASPDEIKALIKGGEVTATTQTLGRLHNIPVGMYIRLSNIISLILVGALLPEDVVRALHEMLEIEEEAAKKLADDLEHTILEKARVLILGKDGSDMKTLTFDGEGSKEELRKAIMDTTKRDSALTKSPVAGEKVVDPKKTVVLAPGSRSQLLEQLQILGSIPNDEEIETRLKHIHEQIDLIKKQEEDNTLTSNVALKSFMFGEKGKEVADSHIQVATYSRAPTEYNVDPYREIAAE